MYSDKFKDILKEVKKVINGKDKVIITILLAILANGNILLEDIPGVGKTTMALAFTKALGLTYGRLQFTPDTLPSDITGYVMYDKATGKMIFYKGVIFCNIFLADELNRTSSRTQSALLEAMEEHQVTIESHSYKLDQPFCVIATQNPVGASGTQLLPDSQTDRFMVKLSIGYPNFEDECKMILNRAKSNPLKDVNCVITKEELIEMQNQVKNVFVHKDMAKYIVSLVEKTRNHPNLLRGASPRATLSLTEMSKAIAFASNRDFIIPDDVKNVFISTIGHRIILNSDAITQQISVETILQDIINDVLPPEI